MPDCPEKLKLTFQIYYETIMQIPFPVFPDIMQQIGTFFPDAKVETIICNHCNHENSVVSPICIKCGRHFDDSAMVSRSDVKSTLRIDKVPFNPAKSAMPKTTEQQLPFAHPPGCSVAIVIASVFVSVVLWWWAIGQDNVKWYGVVVAVIFSIFTIAPLPLHIKNIFKKKK